MYRKSGYYFAGLFGAALVAFWPQYLSRLGAGGISVYIHVHAVLMTTWFGLLIAQPFLLRAGHDLGAAARTLAVAGAAGSALR